MQVFFLLFFFLLGFVSSLFFFRRETIFVYTNASTVPFFLLLSSLHTAGKVIIKVMESKLIVSNKRDKKTNISYGFIFEMEEGYFLFPFFCFSFFLIRKITYVSQRSLEMRMKNKLYMFDWMMKTRRNNRDTRRN